MKITNNFNLPPDIYKALSFAYKPLDGKFRITELIGPPLIRQLKIEFWDALEEDASERLWALLGQGVHAAIEKHVSEESFSEERIETKYGNYVIMGSSDVFQMPEQILRDYKVTSVFSFLLGDKPEWERQLNCYAWMWRKFGYEPTKLVINAILRDWQRSRSLLDSDYPSVPFINSLIRKWPNELCEAYIAERMALHTDIAKECSPEEKWARPTTFAVMKDGGKRAIKNGVCDTKSQAESRMAEEAAKGKGKYTIVERPGAFIKCRDYCPVRNFCKFNIYKGLENVITEE